mmetsp:Transcript_68640/g.153799  ORF Transcript_68640/g.153799 Transcript_68640/m.153799 type:complete len:294 (-) Transcript_68640:56-937(-)
MAPILNAFLVLPLALAPAAVGGAVLRGNLSSRDLGQGLARTGRTARLNATPRNATAGDGPSDDEAVRGRPASPGLVQANARLNATTAGNSTADGAGEQLPIVAAKSILGHSPWMLLLMGSPPMSYRSASQILCFWLVSWLIWTTLGALVAPLARSGHIRKEPSWARTPADEFEGDFRDFRDMKSCMLAWFCTHVQWADTVFQAGLLGFWPAFALFSLCGLVNTFHYGYFVWGLPTIFLQLWFRYRIRRRVGLADESCALVAYDFCCICTAPCSYIAQEARGVKSAYKGGKQMR